MAEKLWYGEITNSTDWGGDDSTDNLPVAGEVIQKYIKDNILDKIGYVYHDQVNGYYLFFANKETCEEYLQDTTKVELIKGSLKAPLGYTAQVNLITPYYSAILLGSTGNRLEFGFDIKNSSNQSYVDNIDYTITIRRNATEYKINGNCTYGKLVTLNVDQYLDKEGTITFLIEIKGQITTASATSIITYDVINLSISNQYNSSNVYNVSLGDPLTILYSLFGSSNIKYVEWYIDGKYLETDTHTGGTAEALIIPKTFSVEGYQGGVHNVQFRAYVEINGEKFYTETLYREFIVLAETTPDVSIAVETVIPPSIGIIDRLKLYNVKQYEPYTFEFGVYNKKNLESVDVEIYINDVLQQVIKAQNSKELSYTFIPDSIGDTKLTFKSGNIIKDFNAIVDKTDMNISEITTNLQLSLSAIGKSNFDVNRDSWDYGRYTTKFNGFTWSGTSGWNNNRLVIGEGMSINIDINPLESNANGKTIEIEFETINVINDDAVICDVRDSNGVGLLITASEASLRVSTASDQIVSTKFKSGENHRIGFVLDNLNKLALIYVDGIVSGAIKISSTTFSVSRTLDFIGSSDAGIRLKQIIVLGTSLDASSMLNNFILYRDTIQDMTSIYERNNIMEDTLMSIDKVADQLPVMLLTGDVNWINTQTSKDAETDIDAEYINRFDPTRSFKLKGGRLRLQGTSSSAYPIKNFRLYTQRKSHIGVLTDYLGNIVLDNKLSFRLNPDSNLNAVPVDCWCLKADYAESSSTHNTAIANIWNRVMYWAFDDNEGYVCRTKAQKAALENGYPYDVRTTVDGFPIAVFSRQSEEDEYIFVGKYNFNNDKSTENVFGFCDIPGFDNSKMQCWEMLENGNNYALFQTTEGWYNQDTNPDGSLKFNKDGDPVPKWASGFEARYPDDGLKADTSDLKAFIDWIISCDAKKFYDEKKDHIDIWKTAAYYVYFMRFGAVDQVVKNSMFTSEDGIHWYYINYDNDTINGLKNTGALIYPPTITRDTIDGTTYAYAGHDSRLWNLLEADDEFMRYVSRVDTLLYKAGLTYQNVLKYFNENQSDKWCERIYNQDATYKYINPSLTTNAAGSEVNTLFMLQGSRKAHRTWWLAKRFKLMDGKFNNDQYTSQNCYLKLNGSPGLDISITAGDYMYYGCKSNSIDIQMGVLLDPSDPDKRSYTFHKDQAKDADGNPIPGGKDFAVGDPIYIYAPYALEELDLSKVARYLEELTLNVSDPILGTRLKRLIISSLDQKSQQVKILEGLGTATNLEYLDIRGLQIGSLDLSKLTLLRTLLMKDSGVVDVVLPDGCVIDKLQISDVLNSLTLSNLPNLTIDNIEGFDTNHISKLYISNCSKITDNFGKFYNWVLDVKKDDVLELSGIYWSDVNPISLLDFKLFKEVGAKLSLKGKIVLSKIPELEQVEMIQEIFGKDCFTNNAELWVRAPESVFIHGPHEIRSGDSQVYTTTIFSENPGTVTWEIESGSEWVKSIESNPDNTGVLTTIEDTEADHVIVIKAIHKPAITAESSYLRVVTFEVLSKKVIYATEGSILGNATVQKDTEFRLELGPDNFNGDFSTTWSIDSESDLSDKVRLDNTTNTSCTIKYLTSTTFELATLIAKVTNKNNSTFEVKLIITITDENVLMTSTSNPEVIAICYDNGWCESPNVMYKSEAQKVIDIGQAFRGGNYNTTDSEGNVVTITRPGSYIKHFDELEEFWNITSIPDNAFTLCTQLTSIKLPANISYIGSLAFQTVTSLETIHIPTNVIDIHFNAFQNTSIKQFTVSSSNVKYKSLDGILVSSDGILVKYPEGKLDESYTTDPFIVGLGDWSITQTKLKRLVLSDNVVSHGTKNSYSINSNSYLESIYIGKSVDPVNLARHIISNGNLKNINVSKDHPKLMDIDGVVYDITGLTLWKYPEGRSEFIVSNGITSIGQYSVAYSNTLVNPITIPDNIEIIDEFAFFSDQQLKGIIFNQDSKLKSIKANALQLLINITSLTLPSNLESLDKLSLASLWKLSELRFLGLTAPVFLDVTGVGEGRNITTVFGNDDNSFTGRMVVDDMRILRVPANSVGYDDQDWINSILSKNRNKFTISKVE